MSTEQIQIWPLVATVTSDGPIVAAYGPMRGGYIMNPDDATEPLYVAFIGDAGTDASDNTVAVAPGAILNFPTNLTGNVSVNAQTPGHAFSGVVYQPGPDFKASTATFPPAGQTSLVSALPQYLYQQYNDDEDLRAFVSAFNALVQEYMDWATTINLPIYTGLSGDMLDWVLENYYGIKRSVLPYGLSASHGPLNTDTMNSFPLNNYELIGPQTYYLTTDDTYKRIATWFFWLGDGRVFNLRYIKRKIERFLTGEDGGPGDTDQTYDVSITFGVDGEMNINLQSIRRIATGGAIMDFAPLNSFAMNEFDTIAISVPISPLAQIFKAAVEAGVLPFPFQIKPIVNIN